MAVGQLLPPSIIQRVATTWSRIMQHPPGTPVWKRASVPSPMVSIMEVTLRAECRSQQGVEAECEFNGLFDRTHMEK